MKKQFILGLCSLMLLSSCGNGSTITYEEFTIKTIDNMTALSGSTTQYANDNYVLVLSRESTLSAGSYSSNENYLAAVLTANGVSVRVNAGDITIDKDGNEGTGGSTFTYASYYNIGSDNVNYCYDVVAARSANYYYLFTYGTTLANYMNYHKTFMKSFYTVTRNK